MTLVSTSTKPGRFAGDIDCSILSERVFALQRRAICYCNSIAGLESLHCVCQERMEEGVSPPVPGAAVECRGVVAFQRS
jgi:hypothetical protein